MRFLFTTLGTIVSAYAVICVLLYIFQKHLIYFPVKDVQFTPRDVGLVYEDLYIETSDHERLHGWYIPGNSADYTILFCHGNAGNISHRLESIKIFHALNLNVLIFDYRGFGKSTGKTDEKGTYLDAEAAFSFLQNTKGMQAKQIIVFGRSLGSGVAAALASQQETAAVILESSFTSLPALGAGLYPVFPIRLLARYNYGTINRLEKITAPILLIHSVDDEIIPYAQGRQNYEAANHPKHFLKLRGSHNDGFMVSGELYFEGLRTFLREKLNESDFQ